MVQIMQQCMMYVFLRKGAYHILKCSSESTVALTIITTTTRTIFMG